jgi:UDP-N-acetylmuramate--alanine ligase
MLGHTLICAGLDPTVIVGAVSSHLADPGKPPAGFRLGTDRVPIGPRAGEAGIVVAEACEFNRSFHALHPRIAAITSVEADHLDIYGTLDAVVGAFAEFAHRLPSAEEGGRLLINHEGAHRREVASATEADVQTIGFNPSADWHVTYDASAHRVGLNHKGRHLGNWTLSLPGEHMAFDSAVAATLAIWLGADVARVCEALAGFRGVDRRMQLIDRVRIGGAEPAVPVYDDYGHHPTEIDITLRALRDHERPEKRGGRLICVFQPHQHSRTRFLLDEFAAAFGQADLVIVPHIYFVRDSEVEKTKVSAADLVDRLRARGVQAMHLYPFDAIVEQLVAVVRPGDTVVAMGAGPVYQVAYGFVSRCAARGAEGAGRTRTASA